MVNRVADASPWRERTRRDIRRLAGWTGAWMMSLALAAFGPMWLWDSAGITLFAVLANLAIGVGMIRANVRHLDTLDELMRRIQLEAMALALGIGIVAGLGYTLLESAQLVTTEVDIGILVGFIGITYLICSIVGYLKYR